MQECCVYSFSDWIWIDLVSVCVCVCVCVCCVCDFFCKTQNIWWHCTGVSNPTISPNHLLTISPHQMHWLLPGRHDWLPRFARYLSTLNKTSPRRLRGSQSTFICQFYVFICLNYENNSVIPNDKVLKKKNNTSKTYLYEEYYFHIIFQLFFLLLLLLFSI